MGELHHPLCTCSIDQDSATWGLTEALGMTVQANSQALQICGPQILVALALSLGATAHSMDLSPEAADTAIEEALQLMRVQRQAQRDTEMGENIVKFPGRT